MRISPTAPPTVNGQGLCSIRGRSTADLFRGCLMCEFGRSNPPMSLPAEFWSGVLLFIVHILFSPSNAQHAPSPTLLSDTQVLLLAQIHVSYIMSEMVSCEVQIELSESRACSTQPYSTTDTGMGEAVHGMSPHNVKALRYYRTRTSNLKSPAPSRMCC